MKKDSTHRRTIPSEDALERYDCDKAMRGRHAYSYPKGAHAVVIASEVWRHFGTGDAVNDGLRVLLKMATLAKAKSLRKPMRTKKRREVAKLWKRNSGSPDVAFLPLPPRDKPRQCLHSSACACASAGSARTENLNIVNDRISHQHLERGRCLTSLCPAGHW